MASRAVAASLIRRPHARCRAPRGNMPFWSPDSRFVAFFANKFKRIDVVGGAVQTIAKTSPAAAAGGTWNEQNIILFSRGGSDGILRVAAGGGEPERLTTTETATGLAGLWPTFLPGGRHSLYLKIVAPQLPRTVSSCGVRSTRRTARCPEHVLQGVLFPHRSSTVQPGWSRGHAAVRCIQRNRLRKSSPARW